MSSDQIKKTNQLRTEYQKLAAIMPLKASFYKKKANISNADYFWYGLAFILAVGLLAGILTGFGSAGSIINAVMSLFPIANIQVGMIALTAFVVYAIPWALVYIPSVGSKFRTWWEGRVNPKASAHSRALEKAHSILQMLYRKEIRLIEKKSSYEPSLNYKTALQALSEILRADEDPATKNLGTRIQDAVKTNDEAAFKTIIGNLAYVMTDDNVETTKESINLDKLMSQYKTHLNYHDKQSAIERTKEKILAKAAWTKIRKNDKNKSFKIYVANFIGSLLGWINAAMANSTGTATAPLFIASALLMVYAPTAVLPFYFSLFLTALFGLAGFVAAYGLTKESIERSFNQIADFFIDETKANRDRKKFKGPITERMFSYLQYLNNKYSLIPIGMALFLAIGIASFNFYAGALVGHLILNPMLITTPIAASAYTISSIAALSVTELFFGFVGFTFTVIAVTPLMVNAWKGFYKSLTLEPMMNNKGISFAAFLATSINTWLLYKLMTRAGSPLNLFFGAHPLFIKLIAVVAPVCIFFLGFALFYMGLKETFSDRGHTFSSIIEENYHLQPEYTNAKAFSAGIFKDIANTSEESNNNNALGPKGGK